MKLALLVTVVMIAFAANSVLNRLGLVTTEGATGPAAFAAIRILSGALTLAVLVSLTRGGLSLGRAALPGAAYLAIYVLGFSFAYVTLDAGLGALILFGGVQLTMFAGAVIGGERPVAARWIGSAVALGGLAWLLRPGDSAPDLVGATLMAAAALGWGLYSLAGKKVADPLTATASAFVLASPLGLVVWTIFPDPIDMQGALFAIASGAITSGLGYALWYSVLPRLETSVAALAQLTVPLIAVVGGLIFLSEPATLRVLGAAAIVLGGVAFGILAPQRKIGSNGS